jgi:hypothetical protein
MSMKQGELGLLRTHSGRGIDESVRGFDLFTGLWWPLRQKSQKAPRREVAWLIAKLYAACPIPQSPGDGLAGQLSRCQPHEDRERERFRLKFDMLLTTPLERVEPFLRWALARIAAHDLKHDWVKLTNDLSIWERESTRLKWAEQFLNIEERGQSC